MVNMRLEVERNNNLEKIGDIIIRQNALMKKKAHLETEKENITRKIKNITRQQEEAIEQDNFDLADQLEAVINQLNENCKNLGKDAD